VTSAALRLFIASMYVSQDMWREGTGYDLVALREVPKAEFPILIAALTRTNSDWRDIEALTRIDTNDSWEGVLRIIESVDSTDTRARGALALFDSGRLVSLDATAQREAARRCAADVVTYCSAVLSAFPTSFLKQLLTDASVGSWSSGRDFALRDRSEPGFFSEAGLMRVLAESLPHLNLLDPGRDAFLVLPIVDELSPTTDPSTRKLASLRFTSLTGARVPAIDSVPEPRATAGTIERLLAGEDPALWDDWREARVGLRAIARSQSASSVDLLRCIAQASQSPDFRLAATIELNQDHSRDDEHVLSALIDLLPQLNCDRFRIDCGQRLLADYDCEQLRQALALAADPTNETARTQGSSRYWKFCLLSLTRPGFDPVTSESDYFLLG